MCDIHPNPHVRKEITMFLSSQVLLFSVIFFSSLLVLLIPFKWLSSSFSKAKKHTLPSPNGLPIIGNLHQLGSSPHQSLRALSQKHGPLMLIHLGSVPVLVVSSVEGAREILKTHDLIFSSRPKLSIPDKLTYGSKDIGFAPYGEFWRQVKSISMVHLLSNRRVGSYRKIREKEMIRMIDMMGKTCGSVVDIGDMLMSLTSNVISTVALGRTYDDLKVRDMLIRLQNLLGVMSVGNFIPWLSWVDWLSGVNGKTQKLLIELEEFLGGVIDEHIYKKKMADSGGNDQEQDLVDILLDLQKENTNNFVFDRDAIKGVIQDIFTGGSDTTSSNLEWAFTELVRHPDIMKKLQTEVTKVGQGRALITEDDIHEMPYLKAVLKETLRLHIPLPLLVPHESIQNVKLMGYDIPEGTQVTINAWAIARDPLIWEEPDKFKPERFLNSSIDYKGFDFEFLPFGAGRRGCPGIPFAMSINELVLANVVYKYDLTLPNEGKPEDMDMSEIAGIALHKKCPLLVVPTPRF